MLNLKRQFLCPAILSSGFLTISLGIVPIPARAATVWTGPSINFTQSASSESDVILPGKVVLTRGLNQVLYNTAAGETAAGVSSPADTEWAFGALNNFSTLTYQPLESFRNTDLAALILNQPMVMHLINEDIYLSVKFTAWGQHGTGGFAYTRSTAAVSAKPTISITSPIADSIFAAPATVPLSASATVTGGTVTNVKYFAGSTLLGSATTSPFNVTGSLINPGAYHLTAVATAAGVTATSAVVSITVVASPTASITQPPNGATFIAPGNVTISADAAVSGGTVTNVAFFGNSALLGSVQNPPFSFTATNLAAGNYSFSVVATADGLSTTSSAVAITVISPVTLSLSAPLVSEGLFSFSFAADPGVSYLIQRSSNLFDWVSIATNVAAGNPVSFSDNLNPNAPLFYRVGRISGP